MADGVRLPRTAWVANVAISSVAMVTVMETPVATGFAAGTHAAASAASRHVSNSLRRQLHCVLHELQHPVKERASGRHARHAHNQNKYPSAHAQRARDHQVVQVLDNWQRPAAAHHKIRPRQFRHKRCPQLPHRPHGTYHRSSTARRRAPPRARPPPTCRSRRACRLLRALWGQTCALPRATTTGRSSWRASA